MLIGCIADDLTGATDLGVNLVREGLSVIQVNGVPGEGELPEADAVVVALKSRTIDAADAVRQSAGGARMAACPRRRAHLLQVLLDLRFHAARQHRPGHRGLAGGARRRIVPTTPAYPRNKRTVYLGHLFVGERAALRNRACATIR